MRVLLVEDEKKVSSFIRKGLEEAGYVIDHAADGEAGLEMALDRVHQLIILDINMPGMDGLKLLSILRKTGVDTPVLLLTIRATIEDKVIGLDTGADDYLPKPFSFQELLARVRALLRRGENTLEPLLQEADLILDPATRNVQRGGCNIELTSKEFTILSYLLRNKGRVLTRGMIAENAWDYGYEATTNIIDVYVNRLRKKIDAKSQVKLLRTVRGTGYVLGGVVDES